MESSQFLQSQSTSIAWSLPCTNAAFEALRESLDESHLPAELLEGERRRNFIEGLREIQWSPVSAPDGFALRVPQRELAVGDELVDALRNFDDDDVAGIARQLVVHELFHDFQALTRANYRQIGRAGLVLEELDFWADVFSVRALAAHATGSERAMADAVRAEIGWVLSGIEAFDRSEYGTNLEHLYERRLRRYLIWYLQHARATTLREDHDVNLMLSSRLAVELVPTVGFLDARGDKVVRRATDRTQLVVFCDGRLVRFPSDDNLHPAEMVDDVRHFRSAALREAMERVVGIRLELLAPWATL